MVRMELSGKGIGTYALIDEDDYEALSKHPWYLRNDGYVATMIDRRTVYLHRMVAKTPAGMIKQIKAMA